VANGDVQSAVVGLDEFEGDVRRLLDGGWSLIAVIPADADNVKVFVKRRG
jgi:hypothetical protein